MALYSHVIVGYDGLREGERALRWAVDEARRRHIRLSVFHAWSWPYPGYRDSPEGLASIRRTAERVLDHGVALAQELAPRTEIQRRLIEGPVASALGHESLRAELIVVGANGHDEMPLGATASRVAAGSSCPVIVVRDAGPGDGRIVIGFDDSEASDAALAFGFEEAALQGWRVHIVHGHGSGQARGTDIEAAAEPEAMRRMIRTRLESVIGPWRTRYPNLDARLSIVAAPPRRALAEAGRGAQMLVVGDRDADGYPPQLLGSTSQAMLQYAQCPVAVVHPARREGAADRAGAHLGRSYDRAAGVSRRIQLVED